MKKINGVKVLLESSRHIGKNPLDFLATNHIQSGQFVSIGYLEDVALSQKTRYINDENDAELGRWIERTRGSRFSEDFDNVRRSEKYQNALSGQTKTGAFETEPIHILKLGRYNFQWKNADRKFKDYEEREIPLEQAIRKHYGFTEFEPEYEFDDDDWHVKKKINKKGEEKYVYGGPSIMPRRVSDTAGEGWTPIGHEGADFFEHETTHNISFRQVLGKNAMQDYQFFYVRESDGVLEPFDKDAYKFLSKAFSRPAVEKACDDLLDQERMFLADMEELGRRFQHRTFNWEKILYMAASTAGIEEGHKTYTPFIWINDDVILDTFSWINKDELDRLIDKSVRISQKDLDEWRKNPDIWESYKGKTDADILCESIMRNIGKSLKELLK